ncbi:MAG: hypothetical protein ACR2OU_05055 [Thermomicrobiales bacterium]
MNADIDVDKTGIGRPTRWWGKVAEGILLPAPIIEKGAGSRKIGKRTGDTLVLFRFSHEHSLLSDVKAGKRLEVDCSFGASKGQHGGDPYNEA